MPTRVRYGANIVNISPTQPTPTHSFCRDLARRFIHLLPGPFRHLEATLALSIITSAVQAQAQTQAQAPEGKGQDLPRLLTSAELDNVVSAHDMQRLHAYSRNLVDFHLVTDLLPEVSKLFFLGSLSRTMTLSFLQRALILGMGLQHKLVDDLAAEYDLPVSQLLALFNKAVRKLHGALAKIRTQQAEADVEATAGMKAARSVESKLRKGSAMQPLHESMDVEQAQAGRKSLKDLEGRNEMLKALDLEQYAVGGDDDEWREATANAAPGASISVQTRNKNSSSSAKKKKNRDGEFAAKRSGKKHKRR